MVETRPTERRLSEGLASSRTQLRNALLLLRQELDLRRYLAASIRGQTFQWIIAAFLFGWLLSRLPARKMKIYYSVDQREAKVPGRKKKRKLWKMVWDTSQPVIAAYLAKKLAEKIRTSNRQTPEKEGVFLG